jgi:hypothetical protein
MNSYYSTIGASDGTIREIFIWAESLKAAESIVIYQWIPTYIKEKNKYASNLYSKTERNRNKERAEFILSIHHNLIDLNDIAVFFVTVRKCRDLRLYDKKPLYS